MSPKHWFVLACRVMGVWTLLGAITSWVTVHNVLKGFFRPESTSIGGYVLHAAVDTVLGLYLLVGSAQLASLVYGHSDPDSTSEADVESQNRK